MCSLKKKGLHSESGTDLSIFLRNVFLQTRETRFRKPLYTKKTWNRRWAAGWTMDIPDLGQRINIWVKSLQKPIAS